MSALICLKNQAKLRTFLRKVRTRHGLSRWDFAPLIGVTRPAYYNFERDESKKLGADSIRAIGRKLSLGPEVMEAMLNPEALPVKLPPPQSINLLPADDGEVLIDLETAAKMIGAISAAGKPLPLGQLLQIAR